MATENQNTALKKYLDFSGLALYHNQLKAYLAGNNVSGVIGLADKASKLATPRQITLIGGVSGDGTFDGSSNVTISTTLNISGTLNADISGNAATATAFSVAQPINLTGDLTGYGLGGTSASGWTVPVTLSDGAVTNIKLAGGITNNKLVNSSITLGTTPISLGETKTVLTGLESITAGHFIGDLTGTAVSASQAEKDSAGNVITATYATKAELDAAQSAFNFKGSVPTYADLPANPVNGDIYSIEDTGVSYIWSADNQAWSVFGSSYGPATASTLGLVKVGDNITNTSGTISLTQANVDTALGYSPIRGVRVNGTAVVPTSDRYVSITVPTDYATAADIEAAFTSANILSGLGYSPIENVSLNGTDLAKTNNRVNLDLSAYATQAWTQAQITQATSSLYTFKGSVSTYADLLNIQSPASGDVYNVITGNDPTTGNPDWPAFTAGTNFAWDGDEWDSLGGSINLSDYYNRAEVDTLLAGKASSSHSHNDLYYTKAEVDEMIAALRSEISQQIQTAQTTTEESGETNDIRTFESASEFPAIGTADVLYLDSQTGILYSWVSDGQGGGEYVEVHQTASSSEINSLFNS